LNLATLVSTTIVLLAFAAPNTSAITLCDVDSPRGFDLEETCHQVVDYVEVPDDVEVPDVVLPEIDLAQGPVHAGFIGSSGCSGLTGDCDYNWNGIHYADIGSTATVGVGTFETPFGTVSTCTFVGPVSCATPGMVGTAIPESICSSWLMTVTSTAILGGGYDSNQQYAC
jgi:hypothetical protein